MVTVREWMRRLWGTFRPTREDRDLEQELRCHLEMVADDARHGTDGPESAIRAARIRAGGAAQAMEALREQRGLPWLTDLTKDLRYACRTLAGHPGFTTVVVGTLALGIGANTAVFSIADTLLFRPPPFDHSERLYWIYDVNDKLGLTIKDAVPPSPGNFLDWRDQNRSFDYMVAWRNWWFSVAGAPGYDATAEQVRGVNVSPAFFEMLGVQAALGRTFRQDEEQPGQDQVVVLTHGFWQRRFGSDPDIVRRTIVIDGRPFSIIGVLPSDFYFLWPDSAIFMPMRVDGGFRSHRSTHSVVVLARLAPGVTRTDAQSEMDRLARDLERAYPATNDGWRADLLPVFPLNKDLRPALLVLLGAVGCVLLIACVNVASLLLVRAGVRRREMAIRTAVGASRGRLIRQMLAESAVLAGMGTVGGVLLAVGGLRLLIPWIPQVQIARPLSIAIDTRVLFFTLGTAVLTASAFGLLPALQASRTERLRVSAQSGRGATGGRALLTVEIALSLMLLIGATLLVRSLWNLQQVDPGFRAERLLTMQLWLPEEKYAAPSSVSGFYQELLRRLDQFPEVRAAAVVNTRPFLGWSLGATVDIPGRTSRTSADEPIVGSRIISPGYLAALGTPLIRGRSFSNSDGPENTAVALVNEVMAHRFWPTEDPIGKIIRVRSLGATSSAPWWPDQMTDTFTIAGVVGNIKESRLNDQVEAVVYLSYLQNPSRYAHLLVRTESTPTNVTSIVQREITAVDPDLGVYDVQTMETVLGQAVAGPKLNSLLLWVFATIALLLSAVGVYGVTSYAVAQRSREFAIRLAIGAPSRSVFRIVTREGLTIAIAGISIGLGGALLLARTLASLLYGIVPTDRTALIGSAGVVLVVALLACCRPAWRATRVDPISVLRVE
jgi:predicted permease